MGKLKLVIVDDDAESIELVTDFCRDIPYIKLAGKFQEPMSFIKQIPRLEFDLCVISVSMKHGLEVARHLEGKPFIFLVKGEYLLRPAIDMSPIDIVSKPLKKERFNIAVVKAHKQILSDRIIQEQTKEDNSEYVVLSSGFRGKIRIKPADILHAYSHKEDTRHKHIIMRDGTTFLATYCPFSKLSEIAPHLRKVNNSEMVSVEKIKKVTGQTITISYPFESLKEKSILLARTFRPEFRRIMQAC
jgi:DNA-binding LytR/AlgR family response regulator